MNAEKTKDGWVSSTWNTGTEVWDKAPFDAGDEAKREAVLTAEKANVPELSEDDCDDFHFVLHTADVSGEDATYNSGILNYRCGSEHSQHRF